MLPAEGRTSPPRAACVSAPHTVSVALRDHQPVRQPVTKRSTSGYSSVAPVGDASSSPAERGIMTAMDRLRRAARGGRSTSGGSAVDSPRTVLVVDDDKTIVDLLRDFLEAAGFRVE